MFSTVKTWLLVIIVAPAVILALLAGAGYFFAASESGQQWILDMVKEEVRESLGAELEIEGFKGNLLWRVEAKRVRLAKGDREIFQAQDLEVSYNLLAIIGGSVRMGDLKVSSGRLDLGALPQSQGQSEIPGITIKRLAIKDFTLAPGGMLGPVTKLAGLSISGRLDLYSRRSSFKGKLAVGELGLQGLAQPLGVKAHVDWEDERLKLHRVDISQGPNQLVAVGGLHFGRQMSMDLKLTGQGIQAGALPVAWPGPVLPGGDFAFKASASGPLNNLALTAVVLRGDGRLRLRLGLNLDSGIWAARTTLKQVDLAQWGLAPDPVLLEGQVNLKGKGLPMAEGSELSVESTLQQVAAYGHTLSSFDLKASLMAGVLKVERLAAKLMSGTISGQGQLKLDDGLGLAGKLEFSGLRPPDQLTAPLKGVLLSGSLELAGTVSDLGLKLNLADSKAGGQMEIKTLAAEGRITEGAPSLSSLDLAVAGLDISAQGRADLKGMDLKAEVDIKDLAALADALSRAGLVQGLDLAGSGQASLSMHGPWSSPALELVARLNQLKVPEVRASQVEVTVRLSSLSARPKGWLRVRAHEVSAAGDIWPEVDLNLESTVKGPLLRVSAQSRTRRVSLKIQVEGSLAWPLKATLSSLAYDHQGYGRWRQKGSAELGLQPDSGQMRGLEMIDGDQRVMVSGGMQPGGAVSGRLEMLRLHLEPYLPEDTLPETARLDVKAELGGTLAAPLIKMDGEIHSLKVAGLPPIRARLSGDYAKGWLTLKGDVLTGKTTTADLRGRWAMDLKLMPPWLEQGAGTMDFKLRSRDLRLSLFEPFVPGLSKLGGRIDLSLDITGEIEAPRITGDLSLKNGSFTLTATGQTFRRVTAKLHAKGREIVVEELSLQDGGTLVVKGLVVLPDGGPGSSKLRARAKGLRISLGPWGEIKLDADLALAGTPAQPRLSGVITPREIFIRIGKDSPDSIRDLVFIKPGQKAPPLRRKPPEIKPPPFLDPFKVVVVVAIDRVLRLKLNNGWLELTGLVEIKKEPDKLLTYHRGFKLAGGRIIYEGRAFKVLGGEINFTGKSELDPDLRDLRAELTMGNTKVQVVVQGPASDPVVGFTSRPPMSQADILSTIVFGQPAAGLRQDQYQTLSTQALALLGLKGRHELERIVGKQLAPDVVTVGRGYDVGSFLEAGKFLSDDLYLRYRRSAEQSGGQNVGIEYRFTPYFSIESQVGTTRDTGVDLTFTFDF